MLNVLEEVLEKSLNVPKIHFRQIKKHNLNILQKGYIKVDQINQN